MTIAPTHLVRSAFITLIIQSLQVHIISVEIRPNVELHENPLTSLTGGFIISSFDVIDELNTYHDVTPTSPGHRQFKPQELGETDAVLHEFPQVASVVTRRWLKRKSPCVFRRCCRTIQLGRLRQPCSQLQTKEFFLCGFCHGVSEQNVSSQIGNMVRHVLRMVCTEPIAS